MYISCHGNISSGSREHTYIVALQGVGVAAATHSMLHTENVAEGGCG